MVKITFVEFDGSETEVYARPGLSLMKNAVAANVPGVLAECGGNCACGTCRICYPLPTAASAAPLRAGARRPARRQGWQS